jgi:hypothetical protein
MPAIPSAKKTLPMATILAVETKVGFKAACPGSTLQPCFVILGTSGNSQSPQLCHDHQAVAVLRANLRN